MKTAIRFILGAILCASTLTAVAQSACDPVEPPRGILAGMLYGMGQAMTAHSGLPTDQQIQQVRCQQELQLRQLELQQRQLEMERRALELQEKAAEPQTQKATAEAVKQAQSAPVCNWVVTSYGGYCANTVLQSATKPVPPPNQTRDQICRDQPIMWADFCAKTATKTPAQDCRDRGFNWYGYCADKEGQ